MLLHFRCLYGCKNHNWDGKNEAFRVKWRHWKSNRRSRRTIGDLESVKLRTNVTKEPRYAKAKAIETIEMFRTYIILHQVHVAHNRGFKSTLCSTIFYDVGFNNFTERIYRGVHAYLYVCIKGTHIEFKVWKVWRYKCMYICLLSPIIILSCFS